MKGACTALGVSIQLAEQFPNPDILVKARQANE